MQLNYKTKALKSNFGKLFWIKAFLNLKAINVVATLFYLHRGLTLSQVFYTAIVWAIVGILSEVPSSYLADKWGRKKTIILGVFFGIIHWGIMYFADNLLWFLISFAFFSLSFACISGTDEALIYDTNKELGNSNNSLKVLGKLQSAQNIFKIFMPLLAAFIAKDLLEWQFLLIITIDFVGGIIALIISSRLYEPNHHIDVEKMEAGVMRDAINIIKKDWDFIRAILNKTIIFIAGFVVWRYHQKMFIDLGMTVLVLGIGWSISHIILFFLKQNISKVFKTKAISWRINILNIFVLASTILFVSLYFFNLNIYILLVIFLLIMSVEVLRWPLFSEYFNKKSFGYNRATTLSLSNFLKSILDIPLLFIGSWLVGLNIIYPFIFSAILCIITIVIFWLPKANLTTNN